MYHRWRKSCERSTCLTLFIFSVQCQEDLLSHLVLHVLSYRPALRCLCVRLLVVLSSTFPRSQTPLWGLTLEVKASSQWSINDPTATDFSEVEGLHRYVSARVASTDWGGLA